MIGWPEREPIDVTGLGLVADRPDWRDRRVAVLGDIHANSHALRAALDAIDSLGITSVLCHGDLLTYGCHPAEVLDLVDEMIDRHDAVLLTGNHDVTYLAPAGEDPSVRPPFVADSVAWTMVRIAGAELPSRYPWVDTCTVGPVLFSHSDPFEARSWRYLNRTEDEADAASALIDRGALVGVFGHTHRARLTVVDDGRVERRSLADPVDLGAGATGTDCWVLNTGSIGQPRGEGSSWLELDLSAATAKVHPLIYDTGRHLAAIRASGLPAATIDELCSFFDPSGGRP